VSLEFRFIVLMQV